MHLPINVKSPNNISKWQVGFNSVFKRLKLRRPWLGLTEGRIKEESCNIWPECFCSFRWVKNVFLFVNTKVFETPDSIREVE
jgi:hypothetical protein